MQFYKQRDFGKLVNDTIQFFKLNWKNFFKNYFFINGSLLILLVLIFVFGYRELISQLFETGISSDAYFLQEYFLENQAMLIIVSLLLFIIFAGIMIVAYSYPVLYMKRMSETGVKEINTDSILEDMKANGKRYLKLFTGLFLFVFPVAFIIFLISYVLLFVGIGFFLLLFVVPVITNTINFLIFDYFHTDKKFFACLNYAIKSQFSYPVKNGRGPFWKYWGSTSVIYFMIQTISSIFTMIPAIIFFITAIVIPESNGTPSEELFTQGTATFLLIIYIVSITVSLIFMNIQYVNGGLMYYDSRIDLHREADLSEIDTIGSNED